MAEKEWKHQLTEILDKLSKLEEKYSGLGQDMMSYLEGLYYSNGLTYWDYIHLDSLLGLQNPRTPFPDEVIFITYHQITELMFKLVKLELDALTADKGENSEYLVAGNWIKRVKRMNNYFRHLSSSFDIMVTGMDKDELRKFRMALLPASGFQSVQFRHIELMSTTLSNLFQEGTEDDESASLEEMYQQIYWKKGGIDLETGKKTITLEAFEEMYDESLLRFITKYQSRNLAYLFHLASQEIKESEEIRQLLRDFDQYVNVYWKLSHLAAASRHLIYGENKVEGTGGTNWRQFLPPKHQKVIFFPSLWSEEEKADWGKAAVLQHFQQAVAKEWMKAGKTE
ncbi:MAG: tryptophan 2,3-dioxygenase family protein [Bacteroidia bacterium]|nr:tryptophan 2,3-dioxygenase family protein [Bacteroidia bacterium]